MDTVNRNIDSIKVHYPSGASTIIILGSNILDKCVQTLRDIGSWDGIVAIVSNRVYNLHSEVLSLFLSSINAHVLSYEDDEKNKTYHYAEPYFNDMLRYQCSRKSCVLGIGGGVTTDFAGYIAASYMRGIDVVYVPTSLLAMVDASIGGKVAVNISAGKNIVGFFHHPKAIIIDVGFLTTLPLKEWRCGFSEIVKHACIGDTTSYSLIKENKISLGTVDSLLYECIKSSVLFKVSIVEKDEHEKNVRAILNFGHTVGHAIESQFEYTISHGEAVAIGMLVESYISTMLGMPKEDFEAIVSILKQYELIPHLYFNPESIIKHMLYDKKNVKGSIRCVLLEAIGKPIWGRAVEEKLLFEGLTYYLNTLK